jgi:hypothetical protein
MCSFGDEKSGDRFSYGFRRIAYAEQETEHCTDATGDGNALANSQSQINSIEEGLNFIVRSLASRHRPFSRRTMEVVQLLVTAVTRLNMKNCGSPPHKPRRSRRTLQRWATARRTRSGPRGQL